MPTDSRTTIATALIGAVLVGLIATTHPSLIPALGLALGAFGTLYVFLKL